MLSILFAIAAAAACPDVPGEVQRAWAAFNDAEVGQAKTILASTYEAIPCQTRPLSQESLLELYRLDGLVSLQQDDTKGATYAALRAVTAAPDQPPPEEYGPALKGLWESWAGRLATVKAPLSVSGAGRVWVDGISMVEGQPRQVILGEHVVQVEQLDGSVRTTVRDLQTGVTVDTGQPSALVAAPKPSPAPAPKPGGAPDLSGVSPGVALPEPERGQRKPRVALLATGLVVGAAGGGLLGVTALREQRFNESEYYPAAFGTCNLGAPCYAVARNEAIASDASQLRAMYIASYAAMGVGVALVVPGLIGHRVNVGVGVQRLQLTGQF